MSTLNMTSSFNAGLKSSGKLSLILSLKLVLVSSSTPSMFSTWFKVVIISQLKDINSVLLSILKASFYE